MKFHEMIDHEFEWQCARMKRCEIQMQVKLTQSQLLDTVRYRIEICRPYLDYVEFPEAMHDNFHIYRFQKLIEEKLQPCHLVYYFMHTFCKSKYEPIEDKMTILNYFNPFVDSYLMILFRQECGNIHFLNALIIFWMTYLYEVDETLFMFYLRENYDKLKRNSKSVNQSYYENHEFIDCYNVFDKTTNYIFYLLTYCIEGYVYVSKTPRFLNENRDKILDILRITYKSTLQGIFGDIAELSRKRLNNECFIDVLITIINETNFNCSVFDVYDLSKIKSPEHFYVNSLQLEHFNYSMVTDKEHGCILNFEHVRDCIFSHCYGYDIRNHYNYDISEEFETEAIHAILCLRRVGVHKDLIYNKIIPEIYELHQREHFTKTIERTHIYTNFISDSEYLGLEKMRKRLLEHMSAHKIYCVEVYRFVSTRGTLHAVNEAFKTAVFRLATIIVGLPYHTDLNKMELELTAFFKTNKNGQSFDHPLVQKIMLNYFENIEGAKEKEVKERGVLQLIVDDIIARGLQQDHIDLYFGENKEAF